MPAGQVGGVPQPPGRGVEGAGGADDQAPDVLAGDSGRLDGPVEGVGDLTYDAGGGAAGVRSSYSPTISPVMSATAAWIRDWLTSSPAAYAARAFTV